MILLNNEKLCCLLVLQWVSKVGNIKRIVFWEYIEDPIEGLGFDTTPTTPSIRRQSAFILFCSECAQMLQALRFSLSTHVTFHLVACFWQ